MQASLKHMERYDDMQRNMKYISKIRRVENGFQKLIAFTLRFS